MKAWLYYRLSNDDDPEQNALVNQRNICRDCILGHEQQIICIRHPGGSIPSCPMIKLYFRHMIYNHFGRPGLIHRIPILPSCIHHPYSIDRIRLSVQHIHKIFPRIIRPIYRNNHINCFFSTKI